MKPAPAPDAAKDNKEPQGATPPRFEFGAPEDFQLKQAMNHLKGEPVIASVRETAAASTQPAEAKPVAK